MRKPLYYTLLLNKGKETRIHKGKGNKKVMEIQPKVKIKQKGVNIEVQSEIASHS